MASNISISAALHCLGKALGTQDDYQLDSKMTDIDEKPDLNDFESIGQLMECEQDEPSSDYSCPIARIPV